MKIPALHEWNLTTAEARDLQIALRDRVDVARRLRRPKIVAAADVSYSKFDPRLYAAVVVVDAESMEVIEQVSVMARATFPYVPGLLTFREAPPLIEAFRRLETVPDVVLVDGQGVAHPRRMGIAAHLGLWLGIPTVGCAKSRLIGTYEEPGRKRGSRSPLMDGDEVIGSVVRTRDGVKPLFVSSGHLCDLESAVEVVLGATRGLRLPVPARMAHALVNVLRRADREEELGA